MKSYTYEVHTYNRGTIIGTIDAKSIEDALIAVKELHPRYTRIKVE